MKTLKVDFVNLGAQYLDLREKILAKVDEISKKGAYILGEEVAAFERKFAEYCDTKHAVAVANGTDALFLVLKAKGIGPGDEVITAPNSFIASAGAVVQAGGRPVFADVGEDYNLDPDCVKKAITSKTKAILPVHLTGMPADMDPLLELAREKNLFVLEDCAQAIGATYKNRKVGSLGLAGAFSLHPLKNLHVPGDGGMITTNDNSLYEELLLWRNHGLRNRDECDFYAYNSRLDALLAAVGNIKMPLLEGYTRRFQEIAYAYESGLQAVVRVPVCPPERRGVFHNFVIMVDGRSDLQKYLLERGVETKIHYPIPLHLQRASSFLGYKKGDFPISETQAEKILSLPIYPELTDDQVQHVIGCICEYFE